MMSIGNVYYLMTYPIMHSSRTSSKNGQDRLVEVKDKRRESRYDKASANRTRNHDVGLFCNATFVYFCRNSPFLWHIDQISDKYYRSGQTDATANILFLQCK